MRLTRTRAAVAACRREQIANLERFVQGELRPDLTLLLDAPIEISAARAQRAQCGSGHERSLRAGTAGILRARAQQPTSNARAVQPGRFAVIDATAEREQRCSKRFDAPKWKSRLVSCEP